MAGVIRQYWRNGHDWMRATRRDFRLWRWKRPEKVPLFWGVGLVCFGIGVWIVLLLLVNNPRGASDEIDSIAKILGLGGGVALLGQHLLKTRFTEDTQIAERFSRSIEHLGKDASQVAHLGGIYALERIARDSARDHWQVMEYLCAFARNLSPADGVQQDIQAVLTVVGRRESKWRQLEKDAERLDLRGINGRGADLADGHFERAGFASAHLPSCRCTGTRLARVTFADVELNEAVFCDADLRAADLRGARLAGARIAGCCLEEAELDRADLSGAHFEVSPRTGKPSELGRVRWREVNGIEVDLRGAKFSPGSEFQQCDLRAAWFSDQTLNGLIANDRVVFDRAHFERADLCSAQLQTASFQGTFLGAARMREVQAMGANFHEADLSDAGLERANFAGARLENAKFCRAQLAGADLRAANLEGADFRGADLEGTLFSRDGISGAIFDPGATPSAQVEVPAPYDAVPPEVYEMVADF